MVVLRLWNENVFSDSAKYSTGFPFCKRKNAKKEKNRRIFAAREGAGAADKKIRRRERPAAGFFCAFSAGGCPPPGGKGKPRTPALPGGIRGLLLRLRLTGVAYGMYCTYSSISRYSTD